MLDSLTDLEVVGSPVTFNKFLSYLSNTKPVSVDGRSQTLADSPPQAQVPTLPLPPSCLCVFRCSSCASGQAAWLLRPTFTSKLPS